MSAAAVPSPGDTAPAPWLSLVGIGEDGAAGLGAAARTALAAAEFVVGGRRHLALAAALLPAGAETLAWPSPIEDGFAALLARRGRPVVVLASGDPFFHGIGSVLARHIPAAEMQSLPAPSAVALACARLGWAAQDCRLVSLHGRPFARIRPQLQPGARLLVLSWDGTTPALLAEELVGRGLGGSRLVVLEAMGGPRERVRDGRAETMRGLAAEALNTVAIEVVAGPGAAIVTRAAGRPDDLFDNDGQITRAEVRAITLAALAPRGGDLLWDVGGGSGAVAIEWLLADERCRAVAIESRTDRAARIRLNAEQFGVPALEVVEGRAPAALAGLPTPDAVFVGGGFGETGMFEAVWAALPEGGRLVVNAVTLETEARLIALHGSLGGRLIEIALAEAGPVGGFRAFRPGMTVVQWAVRKGGG